MMRTLTGGLALLSLPSVAEKVGTYKLSRETYASTMTASILVLLR